MCMCVVYPWKRWHHDTQRGKYPDDATALCNVLLGNLGFWQNPNQIPKDCCRAESCLCWIRGQIDVFHHHSVCLIAKKINTEILGLLIKMTNVL